MFEPRRLHPIAAISNFLKQLKDLLIPFIVFIALGSRDIGGDGLLLVGFGIIGILLFLLGSGILSWYRFTYRLEEEELRIEYGVFVRKKRFIPFERIQSLDLSEGLLHRPFGLVKVKVETAGSSGLDDAEAVLTAIKKEEALAIQDELAAVKKMKALEASAEFEEQSPKEMVIYQISTKELLLLASTSGGVGVVISAVFAFFFQFEDFIPYERIFQGVEQFISSGAVFVSVMVFLGFLLAWVISLIGTMLKYANFTVREVDGDLIITRGLLEKRQLTIPLKRIQAVRISENLVRQPLGYGTVYLESAGGSAVNEESSKVVLLPIVRKGKIQGMIQPYLKEYEMVESFTPVPKRALIRYLVRGWLLTLPVIVVPILIFKAWGLLALLLLIPSSIWSFIKFKDAGWNIHSLQLTLRYRTASKHTVYMTKSKIQSFMVKESFFQRKRELASIDATVKSGSGGAGGEVIDLEKEDTVRIFNWYSNSERSVIDFHTKQH